MYNENTSTYYDGTYTLTFSDYDTTIVEGSTEPSHSCSYVNEIASPYYLKTEATCEDLATYFYSCECGQAGVDWFKYGYLADCEYGDWYSNNDGTHTRVCARNTAHTETECCSGGSATCVDFAICDVCGEGERLIGKCLQAEKKECNGNI